MPLLIIGVVFFAFLPVWIAWRISHRLVLAVPFFIFIGLTALLNAHDASALMTYATIALVIWRWIDKDSFYKHFWGYMRGSWRRWRIYDKAWKTVIDRLYLNDEQRFKTLRPRIVRVKSEATRDRVLIRFLVGQDPEDFRNYATNFAHAFRAKVCYVRDHDDKPRHLWLEFPRGDTLKSVVPAIPIPDEPDLKNIEIGIYEDGDGWKICLQGTHLYVAGSTGSGKGSVVWSIIRNLAVAIRDGWVEMWVLDPKGGMELKPGLPMWTEYASRYELMAAIIHKCALQMQARSEELAGNTRVHKPSKKYPFVILLIDEMAALTLYMKETNTAIYKQLVGDLGLILTEGRAVGYSVVACAQDPRKEVNSLRNLFPQRIGLQMDEEGDVDLALGKGAVNKGALCHKIKKDPKDYPRFAGTGYELFGGDTTARKTRTAYPTDSDIDFMIGQYAVKKQLDPHTDDEEEATDDERPRSAA